MFENETKLDLETNVRVSKYITRKVKVLIGAVASPFIFVAGVVLLLLELLVLKEGDYFLPIFFIVFGAFMALFMFWGYDKLLERFSRKAMQGKESTMKYTFREEGYEVVTTVNDGTTSSTNGNYPAFTKCCEYKDMWLLYLNQATVFTVKKEGMTKGTAEELADFLVRCLGKKYKVCYKRR